MKIKRTIVTEIDDKDIDRLLKKMFPPTPKLPIWIPNKRKLK